MTTKKYEYLPYAIVTPIDEGTWDWAEKYAIYKIKSRHKTLENAIKADKKEHALLRKLTKGKAIKLNQRIWKLNDYSTRFVPVI